MTKQEAHLAPGAAHPSQRPSMRELLWLRPMRADGTPNMNLARQHAVQLARLPLVLFSVHLAGALAIGFAVGAGMPRPALASLMASLMLVVVLDAVALVFARHRIERNSPRNILLPGFAILLGFQSLCIGFASHIASHYELAGSAWSIIYAAVNFGTIAIGVLASPFLTLCLIAASALTLFLFFDDMAIMIAFIASVPILAAFSLQWARIQIAAANEREELGREAAKALDFVVEFEVSGRGWFWETDTRGTLSYVSQQLADDFECSRDKLLGRRFTDLVMVEQADDEPGKSDERSLGFYLSARFPFNDVAVRASTGEIAWSLSGNPIFDGDGNFRGFRGIGTDLTAQRQQQQEIHRLAKFCSLTGIPNRAMMRKTLEEALRGSGRRHKGATLFMLDLDRFKQVNDTLGHPVGDKLLREVAKRLSSVVGDKGQVGRLGGDEFQVVLPGVVETGLLEGLAKAIIDEVSAPYSINNNRISIGASLGIALAEPGKSCPDTLVRNADLALYAAKNAGRGRHRFFSPAMHNEATTRQLLESDLRLAIERDEIWIAFQPIVDAASEELCGFESLVRWNHPHRGSIGPDIFVPLAEECGMISAIGRHVLDHAVAQAVHWPDHIRLAVNLSPAQFDDPHLVDSIHATITRHAFRSDRLELELTENLFLANGPETEQKLAALKSLGIRLALDDFGTGYSSMGYLQSAPFDKIKIDQGFVRGAANKDKRNAAIIRAIVTLANSLGMDTTAEGVETHEDLELIRELGVSQVQGFIFGRPATASQAAELASRSTGLAKTGDHDIRARRHRLTRRAIASVGGEISEIMLKNISPRGAMAETAREVGVGQKLTLDIVGVGPVLGEVRWVQPGRFGLEFAETFDMARLDDRKVETPRYEVVTPRRNDAARA